MKKYTIKCKKGIDDLQSIYAFHSNDQGGGGSNRAGISIGSGGWWSFNNHFRDKGIDPMDQEAIDKEVLEITKANSEYIDRLYKEGRYGEEYEMSLELEYNPLYDAPPDVDAGQSLSSARIEFINFNKEDNESKD